MDWIIVVTSLSLSLVSDIGHNWRSSNISKSRGVLRDSNASVSHVLSKNHDPLWFKNLGRNRKYTQNIITYISLWVVKWIKSQKIYLKN